jgi:hypothetical protein
LQRPLETAGKNTSKCCVDSTWAGVNVRLAISVAATSEAVLVVPTSAILPKGETKFVQVQNGTEIEVSTGMIAAGEVEVKPVAGQSLNPGDKVVVR